MRNYVFLILVAATNALVDVYPHVDYRQPAYSPGARAGPFLNYESEGKPIGRQPDGGPVIDSDDDYTRGEIPWQDRPAYRGSGEDIIELEDAVREIRLWKSKARASLRPGRVQVAEIKEEMATPLRNMIDFRDPVKGMAHADVEIVQPTIYFEFLRAQSRNSWDSFFERHTVFPTTSSRLWNESGLAVREVLLNPFRNGAKYLDWEFFRSRPDGLPAVAFAHENSSLYKFVFFPGTVQKSGVRAEQDSGHLLSTKLNKVEALHEDVLQSIETGLMNIAKAHVENIVELYEKTLAEFGIQYIVNLRFDYMCGQLTHRQRGIKDTSVMATVFADLQPFIPTEESLFIATKVAIADVGYRTSKHPGDAVSYASQYVRLPILRSRFVTVLGDDFIPKRKEYASGPQAMLLSSLRRSFSQFVARFAESVSQFEHSRWRPKVKLPEVFEDLEPVGEMKHYLPSQVLTFYRGGDVKDEGSMICSEATIYDTFDIIPHLCIQPPTPWSNFYADERFFVQCLGAYPLGTLAYIGHTTFDDVHNHRPNKFSLWRCDSGGWVDARNEFRSNDVQKYFEFCHEFMRETNITPISGDAGKKTDTIRGDLRYHALSEEEAKRLFAGGSSGQGRLMGVQRKEHL